MTTTVPSDPLPAPAVATYILAQPPVQQQQQQQLVLVPVAVPYAAEEEKNMIINQLDVIEEAAEGVDLDEIRDLVTRFKEKRVELGLTQSQVSEDLETSLGTAYSQSFICRIEKLDITPR